MRGYSKNRGEKIIIVIASLLVVFLTIIFLTGLLQQTSINSNVVNSKTSLNKVANLSLVETKDEGNTLTVITNGGSSGGSSGGGGGGGGGSGASAQGLEALDAGAENFTIIAIPDTQNYATSYPAIFTNQTQWVASKLNDLNIVYVTQEGDLVNTASTSEYNNANTSMNILSASDVPFGVAPGNHDSSASLYEQYFGVWRFEGKGYYGGHYGSDNENMYVLFSAGGMDFIAINLEYNPGSAVITWADGLLGTYSGRRGIVTSHDILSTAGSWDTAGQNIYDGLKDNPNLFLMLCGHNHPNGEARRTDTYNNSTIYSLLADYQDDDNQQSGKLRILTFDPSANKIYVKTYSPYTNTYDTDTSSEFVLTYDMGGETPVINTTTNGFVAYNDMDPRVPSGSTDNDPYVTEYSYDTSGGVLKDYDTGDDLPVTITGSYNTILTRTEGNNTNSGTEAANVFGTATSRIVDLRGVSQLQNEGDYATITFNGLNPDKEYVITLSTNRDDTTYANIRYTKVTIEGADEYTQASSSGVVVNSDASVSFSTGYNRVNGYVAKWEGVRSGADGSFSIKSEWDSSQGSGTDNTKGYAMSAVKLEEVAEYNTELKVTSPTTSNPLSVVGEQVISVIFNFLNNGANVTSGVTMNSVKIGGEDAEIVTSAPTCSGTLNCAGYVTEESCGGCSQCDWTMGPATPVLVQEAIKFSTASGKNISCTLSSAATAGDLLITGIATDKSAGNYTVPVGFTLINNMVSTDVSGALAYKIATGGETIITWNQSTSNGLACWAGEYSGLTASSVLDVYVNATSGSTAVKTLSSGTTSSTSQANELAIAIMAIDTYDNADDRAWSNSFSESEWVHGTSTGYVGLSVSKKVLSSVGTVETTFSTTDTGDQMKVILATFKIGSTETCSATGTCAECSTGECSDCAGCSSHSSQQFGYVAGKGWQVNVTTPTGLTGLQDLFVNAAYNGHAASQTQADAIDYGIEGCTSDNECNELDKDYCSGDLVRHDEGRCNAEHECVVETSTTQNCNSLDNNYCSGTAIKKDDYTCSSAACVFSTTTVQECNDALFCNGAESCNAAACVAGTAPIINDNLFCTSDSCDEVNDEVLHTALDVNDNLFCTVDSCNEDTDSVVHAPIAVDDSITCTADSCDEANDLIVHTPQNSLCDNGLYCDGAEVCSATLGCQSGTSVSCSVNNILGINTCNNNPDGIPVTLDFRDAFTSTCDEGTDACTVGSQTITHACNVATCGASCDSTHTCTATDCDNLDKCVGADYYDYSDVSNACLGDCSCESNSCGTPVITTNDPRCGECAGDDDCNSLDRNYCSGALIMHDEGKCEAYTCVVETTTTQNCNDGLFCNGAETCSAASCVAGTAPIINDGISCTADSCDEVNDEVLHAPQDSVCNDGLFCNGAETCSATSGCQAGTAVSCSVNNILGINTCNNNPDGIPVTLDFRDAFTSTCDEGTESCTTGSSTIVHTCDVITCGADCDSTHSCANTECDNQDGCVGNNYYDYSDIANTCGSSCSCTANSCTNPTITTNDPRCVVVTPVCSKNADCGADHYLTSPFCQSDNVWQNFITYTCHNPGTSGSYCSDSTAPKLKETCGGGCNAGKCKVQVCETVCNFGKCYTYCGWE